MKTKRILNTAHSAAHGCTMPIIRKPKLSLFLAIVLLFTNNAIGRILPRGAYSSKSLVSLPAKTPSLMFVENKGQITDQDHKPRTDIDFRISAAAGLNIFIGHGAIHYQFNKTGNDSKAASHTYSMCRMDVELVGANKHAEIIRDQQLDYYENQYAAAPPQHNDQRIKAGAFKKITYKDIYPNIDWVLYSANGELKHEFVIRQGGKVTDIQLNYDGACDLEINTSGDLVATTPQGTITEQAPYTYQKDGKVIASRFKLTGATVSYETGPYEGELIVDPTLAWSTYYGGLEPEESKAVATDNLGNVYMAGRVYSTAGIATSGAHQTTFAGYADAFLVKFNSAGVRQWATYYGGSEYDAGFGVAVDDNGNVYLTGEAWSSFGIASLGAYQAAYGGNGNAFLAKFNSSGVRQWSTYFGISGASGSAVAVDRQGNVYITGNVTASGIATPGAHQGAFGGLWDAFLAKFSTTGTLKWATYYGGTAPDYGRGVASDRWGNVYVTGVTASTAGIASHSALHPSHGGGSYDMFLVKFTGSGVRKWGTYYGGTGDDHGHAVATDGNGDVYITGMTSSSGIASWGTHQPNYTGPGYNAILVKIDSNGWRKWATYYGGNGAMGAGVATDNQANVYLVGSTYDTTDIATPGAYQTTYAGGFDAFLVKFTSWGERKWSTYYGGINDDQGNAVATDRSGNIYLTGITNSSSGIATPGAYQPARSGNSDAFLAKFDKFPTGGNGYKIATTVAPSNVSEYSIYPNPSSGAFNVEIPAAPIATSITVMDLNGRIVASNDIPAANQPQSVQLQLDQTSKGIHFVQIISGANRHMTKILIQ